jgi:hypothetical protein
MVITRRTQSGWLVAELMVAVSIIAVAMIPLAFSFRAEQKLARAHYNQVVAMEIIDGEMELLHAGQWRVCLEGENEYKVTANAARNLPPGKFLVLRSNDLLRLEWRPVKRNSGGTVAREIRFQSLRDTPPPAK